MQEFVNANRLSWDERVAIHAEDETGFYQVAKVLNGEDKLNAIEAREIGDIAGLRVAHLQCHFGLDSFCLERRGADVIGLDFSSAAIAKALGEDSEFAVADSRYAFIRKVSQAILKDSVAKRRTGTDRIDKFVLNRFPAFRCSSSRCTSYSG